MNNSVRPRAFLCIESVLFLKFDHVFITQTFNVSSSNSGTLSFDKYTSQLFSMHAFKNVSSCFCPDGLMARDDCDPMYGGSQYTTALLGVGNSSNDKDVHDTVCLLNAARKFCKAIRFVLSAAIKFSLTVSNRRTRGVFGRDLAGP